MKGTPRPLALLLAAGAALAPPALLLRPLASRAEGSPAASAPAASASASGTTVSAAEALKAPITPKIPRFSEDPPPPEKSKPPTFKEWKEASQPVAFDRDMPTDCSARRVREWVRMTCTEPASMIAIVAGPAEGFTAMVSPYTTREDPSSDNGWGSGPTVFVQGSHFLQFPVRRGERRVFEINGVHPEVATGGIFIEGHSYVVVSWLADEAPTIVVQ